LFEMSSHFLSLEEKNRRALPCCEAVHYKLRESNMFDFKMFDSEHRAWLGEGQRERKQAGL